MSNIFITGSRRRIVFVTWDGGGNFPPQRSLIRALTARGHDVFALAHDVQRLAIEQDGAAFLQYQHAAQLDSANIKDDAEVLANVVLSDGYGADLTAIVARLKPDILIVDILILSALRAAVESGVTTVGFCTGPFGFFEATPLWDQFKIPLAKCDLILGQGYREFDPVAEPPANLAYVGPMRPRDDGAGPWTRRLPDRPLVVVGLSTTQQHQGALLQRLCNVLARLPVEALVTTGRAVAPESLSAPPNVSVVRHASHDAAFPGASLVITHAGMGTVLAGAAHGVPMLCLPMGRDQPTNASQVEALGLGAVLSPDADEDDLTSAILRILADQDVKRRCVEFAGHVANHPDAEHAVELVERLSPA